MIPMSTAGISHPGDANSISATASACPQPLNQGALGSTNVIASGPVFLATPTAVNATSCPGAVDTQATCTFWAQQGECTGAAQQWMRQNCARSCCAVAA